MRLTSISTTNQTTSLMILKRSLMRRTIRWGRCLRISMRLKFRRIITTGRIFTFRLLKQCTFLILRLEILLSLRKLQSRQTNFLSEARLKPPGSEPTKSHFVTCVYQRSPTPSTLTFWSTIKTSQNAYPRIQTSDLLSAKVIAKT